MTGGRPFILVGLILIIVGLVFEFGGRFDLGRLPGDIVVERENFRFSFPLVTCLVISAVLSLGMYLFQKFFR